MTYSVFIWFVATALVLAGFILCGAARKRAGRLIIYGLTLTLFLFAGFRSQQINSDTRSYAIYALHFQEATINENPDIADRLELGFRVFLRLLALIFPAGDNESYPRCVNVTIAVLGGLLLCRAVTTTGDKMGLLLLVYLGSLFFVHAFAIVRLGLATILFLNYLVRSARGGSHEGVNIALLCAGCLLHYTILILAIVMLVWQYVVRSTRNPSVEVSLFGLLCLLAALLGVIITYLAPYFLSGYHLYLVSLGRGFVLSPKGLLEVVFTIILFHFHYQRACWSRDSRLIRWRILFYVVIVSFLVEAVSGLPFVGRFRILAYCIFLVQTVLITAGIDFRKRSTWLVLLAVATSIAAQVITISGDEDWLVVIAGS